MSTTRPWLKNNFSFPDDSVSPDIDSPSPFDPRRGSDFLSPGNSGFGDTRRDNDNDDDLDINKILDLVSADPALSQ
jgi:hypothetical protein